MLRHDDRYFAYGTAPDAGGTIPALTSRDLVDWTPLGDVLEPLPESVGGYWAPEVVRLDDRFCMYYSAGGAEGEGHQLRVATADAPAGPFVDSAVVLDPDDPFTIDAHPFRDDDGTWYLFYCRDFLEGDRVGTGVVVDTLVDASSLSGDRRDVVRPFAEWNLFMKQRSWYGRVWDWYTVEAPFVRKRDGRYYCFFSAGGWRETNYGVSYAVADHPLGPYEVTASEGPALLRTIPGRVHGPGHASITVAPSGNAEYVVYHAWDVDGRARRMCIDLLEWTAEGPRCDGPSVEPRPVPR